MDGRQENTTETQAIMAESNREYTKSLDMYTHTMQLVVNAYTMQLVINAYKTHHDQQSSYQKTVMLSLRLAQQKHTVSLQ